MQYTLAAHPMHWHSMSSVRAGLMVLMDTGALLDRNLSEVTVDDCVDRCDDSLSAAAAVVLWDGWVAMSVGNPTTMDFIVAHSCSKTVYHSAVSGWT